MSRAVIFDMDGTLFRTDLILGISLEDTFEDLRGRGEWEGETPLALYRSIMGAPLPKVWETLLPQHSAEARARVDAYFLERLVDNIRQGRGALYPHVEEVLRSLVEQQYALYIASNGLVQYLSAIVQYFGLDRWVTETFSIERIESLNESDLVAHIVAKHGITSGAVVGDRLSDIAAAKHNGLVAIGCRFDFAQPEELAQAHVVIDDLLELKTVVPQRVR